MSTTGYRSSIPATRKGFWQIVRAEWTKFRSVRGTAWLLVFAVGLTLLLTVLSVAGRNSQNFGLDDRFHFVNQPLTGDGTITARVASQSPSNHLAKAGVIIKKDMTYGSSYAAVMVTPGHGVRFQTGYITDVPGSRTATPRWLRLTRAGNTITGYESADGTAWQRVGAVTLPDLPATVQAGLFVASPHDRSRLVELPLPDDAPANATRVMNPPTVGVATFDNVGLSGVATGDPGSWSHTDMPPNNEGGGFGTPEGTSRPGDTTEAGGTFTVTGSGDIGTSGWLNDTDLTRSSLQGFVIGAIAIVVLGVLFITSEYRRGLIRTTLTASPRRGRVLAAKAIVLGGGAFVAGLVGAVAAVLIAYPVAVRNGFSEPTYAMPLLTNGPTLRAVLGSALYLAVFALLSLGIGVIVRRTASAIVLVVALGVLPAMVGDLVPAGIDQWLHRYTPIAGLAIQQTVYGRQWVIAPWAGLGVLCAYAAVALGVGYWLLRRRDA